MERSAAYDFIIVGSGFGGSVSALLKTLGSMTPDERKAKGPLINGLKDRVTAALASLYTGRRVRPDTSMTGEITLRGSVLPIGGLKEKSLAALRAGIRQVILPKANEKDLEEVPQEAKQRLEFIPVSEIDEVLEVALLPKKEG